MKRYPQSSWSIQPHHLRNNSRAAILALIFLPLISHAIVDKNSDGISDVWEQQYNSGLLFDPPLDPAADSDSDGWTNAREAAAGTNPFDANPPSGFLRPDIINIPAVWGEPDENGNPVLITPDTLRVSWQTIPGKQYTLLFSPDLTAWLPVDSAYVGNGTITEYNFPLSQPTSNFWRVTIEDVDSDGDQLTDAEEYIFATDPANPTTISGIPDLWLAENFASVLMTSGYSAIDPNADPDSDGINTVEELQSGTNPNSADAEGLRQWVTVHGNGEALEEITRTGTLTIPAGQSAILVVGIASEEFPNYTGDQSEFNDLMEWHATPSQGTSIDGSINVNERHVEWEMDVIDGTKLPGLPSPVHIEQVRGLTAPPDSDLTIQVEVSATNISDGQLPSFVAVGLIPMEITWKAIDGFDNVDDHVDPWSNQANGKRIFPDFKNPDDTEIRHKLELIVKTSEILKGKSVFVKALDVDDSTSEAFDHEYGTAAPVIDTHGIAGAGDDNIPDYLNTPQNGQFWDGTAWGGQTAQHTVDANGETKFIFRVGMQPGSNYRVVASVIDQSMYSGVQVSDPAAAKYLGPELAHNGNAPVSPLLTVWRRLWIENDSMEKIPIGAFNYKRNDLNADVENPRILQVNPNGSVAGKTELKISVVSDKSSFQNIQNGQFLIGSTYYPVIATRSIDEGLDQAPESFVTITDSHPAITVGMDYRIYDDDDYGLNRDPLPRTDLIDDVIKNVYKKSFVDVIDAAAWNTTKEISFYRNAPELVGALQLSYGVWADGLDAKLVGNENLWCATIIAGYQGNVYLDSDPSTEGPPTEGITAVRMVGGYPYSNDEARYSIVWVENVRDTLDVNFRNPNEDNNALNMEIVRRVKLTAAHEIGHQPHYLLGEAHHEEGGLMQEGGDDSIGGGENSEFSAASVKRFRSLHKWREE